MILRHRVDVALVADHRVPVRVLRVRDLADRFVHRPPRVREIFVVLAGDRAGLVAIRRLRHVEVHESIGLDRHEIGERLLRDERDVEREVVRRERVVVRAERLHLLLVVGGGHLLRAAEHQVLEEVRVAAAAGLDLVARAGHDERVECNGRGPAHRHDDDAKPVVERVDRHRERLVRRIRRGAQRRDRRVRVRRLNREREREEREREFSHAPG